MIFDEDLQQAPNFDLISILHLGIGHYIAQTFNTNFLGVLNDIGGRISWMASARINGSLTDAFKI